MATREAKDKEQLIGTLIAGGVIIAMTIGGWLGVRFWRNYPAQRESRAAADFLLHKADSPRHLASRGPEAIPALREDLKERDPERQLQVVKLLGQIGPKASAAAPDLIEIFKTTRDPTIKASAAQSLAQLGATEATVDLIPGFKHADPSVRTAVIRAVAALGGAEAQATIPLLVAVLKSDRDASPRIAAVEALANLSGAAADALPELIDACESGDAALSNAALRALVRIERADPRVLSTLIRGLKKDATRVSAATGLAAMGSDARSATPDLIQALQRAELLDEAQRAKAQPGDDAMDIDEAGSELIVFRHHQAWAVESALVSVADGELSELVAARKSQQVEPVLAALKSQDPLMRRAAAEALLSWQSGAPWVDALADSDSQTRAALSEAVRSARSDPQRLSVLRERAKHLEQSIDPALRKSLDELLK